VILAVILAGKIMPEFGTVREHEAVFDVAGLPSAHVREEGAVSHRVCGPHGGVGALWLPVMRA